jgi:uncharacterized coiled-coil DUF342 family protein
MSDTDKLIEKKFKELNAQKDAIYEQTAPLRVEYNDYQAEIDSLMAKQKEVGKEIKKIEADEGLVALTKEISKVALLKNGTKRLGG